jgi:hypothetical protein
MKFLVVMLGFVFLVTYLSVRPSATVKVPQSRCLLFAIFLSLAVFLQFFFLVKVPQIDYWRSGWGGTIHYLNEHFKATGQPYRLPAPGR